MEAVRKVCRAIEVEARRRDKHAGRTRMGISSKHELPRPRMALLSESNMANTFVVNVILKVFQVGNIVKVLEILLVGELANDVKVAVGHCIFGEDVMVWNKDNLFLVPNLSILTELGLKGLDHRRSTDIMRHETRYIGPYVLAWRDGRRIGVLRNNFFGESHRSL